MGICLTLLVEGAIQSEGESECDVGDMHSMVRKAKEPLLGLRRKEHPRGAYTTAT